MAATQRLELRQGQSLVMTPQLQQAIKLLQLSNMELTAYVEGELEQNPLLELDDESKANTGEDSLPDPDAARSEDRLAAPGEDSPGEDGPSEASPGEDGPSDGGPGNEAGPQAGTTDPETGPDTLDMTNDERFPDAAEAPLDTDFENLYNHDGPGSGAEESGLLGGGDSLIRERANSDGAERPGLDQQMEEVVSLRHHLLDQLQLNFRDPDDRLIGLHLVDMLDEAGYVKGDLAALAGQLGCEETRVEATLLRMQSLEPTGIFARSLSECLALQLAERDRLDPAMRALIDNLDLIAKHELTALRRICNVDEEDFADMMAELRALDPKPAAAFDTRPAEPIIPDIFMRPLPKGGWSLELNSDSLPRVLVNERYYAKVCAASRGKADREYLSERFQSANWLVKALDQRAKTILRVASEIVRQQEAFFHKGLDKMKPLTLRDIAEGIEMHESTVSRVTSNKYIATARGTFELKYFFGSSISGADGASLASESVRHRIKRLIDQEPKNKVLSDDSIVSILRSSGVDIARRTVAKYRDAMRIPSSVERRRQKAMHR